MGDDLHHNGALFLPHAYNFMAVFGRPRPEPTRSISRPRATGTDAYKFFLEPGPLAKVDEKYYKDDSPSGPSC